MPKVTLFSLLKGRTLAGRYRVLSLLGAGGMGAVYRAFDQRLEREVALKLISLELADSKEKDSIRARFLREAKTAASVQHPGIVTIFDFDEDPELDVQILVMELLHGLDLQTLWKRGRRYPWPVWSRVIADAADALSAAHARHLIHRDIKPGNLFLQEGFRVKVLDFGIAAVCADAAVTPTKLTREGQRPLTEAYASPEQLRGTSPQPASDQFSLAATAFYLQTGRCVFDEETRCRIAGQGSVPDPEVPDGPGAEVLRRALAVDPRDRFESMSDFAAALRTSGLAPVRTAPLLESIPVGAGEPAAARAFVRYLGELGYLAALYTQPGPDQPFIQFFAHGPQHEFLPRNLWPPKTESPPVGYLRKDSLFGVSVRVGYARIVDPPFGHHLLVVELNGTDEEEDSSTLDVSAALLKLVLSRARYEARSDLGEFLFRNPELQSLYLPSDLRRGVFTNHTVEMGQHAYSEKEIFVECVPLIHRPDPNGPPQLDIRYLEHLDGGSTVRPATGPGALRWNSRYRRDTGLDDEVDTDAAVLYKERPDW